jgi:serine carboxypeptidase-like clade 1
MFKELIAIIILTAVLTASPEEDEVKGLYGDLYKGKIYSGMLDTKDPNRKLHYIFLPSQGNPSTDPLVLWLNGGPGCSSLLGFMQEHGPVVIPDFTRNLEVNNFSWNKVANMLYLETPGGVGFSVNDNKQDQYYDDLKTAQDNRSALLSFFGRFPSYRNNDFYISGESYAGVYVPTLADALLEDKLIKLKGIIVGNGVTDRNYDNDEILIDFAFDHALYSKELRKEYEKKCPPTHQPLVTHECNEVRQKIKDSMEGLNIYDIYRPCPKGKSPQYDAMKSTMKKMSKFKLSALDYITVEFLTMLDDATEEPVGVWPHGCQEDPFPIEFLNYKEIKEKLHVRADIQWMPCNDDINTIYKSGDSINIYKEKLFKAKDLRIWFYSGDTDGAVSFNGSIQWLRNLKLDIKSEYRKWVVNDQTAGYVQEYDGLTYITVKGVGHMVPQWKRQESFVMFSAFLKGEKLPE